MASVSTPLPRVTIQFCTQCKWMLRAAYYAQELLSTFSTTLGEVALQPSTGGTFVVSLYSNTFISTASGEVQVHHHILWDRKADGGFPETKELKRRVRDIIEPGRDLGHVDRRKEEMTAEAVPAELNQPSSEKTKGPAALGKVGPEKETHEGLANTRAIRNARGQEADASQARPINSPGEHMESQDGKMENKVKANGSGGTCEDCH